MINNNRSIENAYNMLRYLYDELRSKRFKTLDISNITTLDNLYGLIISRWCASIAKEGLYKEYVVRENEELTSPIGQINVQESINRQSLTRGMLICSFDELSADIYMNHVLKGTLQYLLYDNNIDKDIKVSIQKAMALFNGVGYVDIKTIHWKDIKFNNSNMRYKHLLEVCQTLVNEHRLEKQLGLDDNRRIYILFKKQLFKWYKLRYEEDTVDTFEMPYTLESESPFETYLNKTQKMIVVKTEKKALVILIRLQDEQMQKDGTLSKQRLNELVGYLREYKKQYKMKVVGTIMYINTDKRKLNLQPITINMVNDYMIGETVIDMHDQWRFIANKLEDVYKYFIAKEKLKKKP